MHRRRTALWAVLILSLIPYPSFSQSLSPAHRRPGTPPRNWFPNPLDTASRTRAELARRGQAGYLRGQPPLAVRMARPGIVPGQFIVRFKPGMAPDAVSRIHAMAGARVISRIRQLDIHTVVANDAAVALYRKDPNVLWIEPNAMRYPLILDPNENAYNYIDLDMSFDGTWGTWRKWDAHIIDAVAGWGLWPGTYFTSAGGKGTASVIVAMIDTGVDEGHEDFKNTGGSSTDAALGGQLLLSLNRTIFNGSTTVGATDLHGHGTHTTGIVAAATNNDIGTIGNGYNANVIDIRVTDSQGNGTSSDLASAITYAADSGAIVANCSLGDYQYSQAEQDAVNYAWNKGMLFVAAAGNDGQDTSVQPVYPAALSKVLGVSATTYADEITSYSDFGDAVGIGAPGGDLDFINLAVVGIYSTTPQYLVTLNDPSYGVQENYDYLMGTSMAAPEVTGTAALYAGMKGWRTATPGAPLQIYQALQRGADDVTGDTSWSPQFGWGRLNLYNTMNLAAVPNPRGDPPTGPIGGITGQVRYLSTVVQNANVVATRLSNGQQFFANSRADGGYRIPNIPTGAYNISATYFGSTQTISNLQVIDGCDVPGADFNISNVPANPIISLTVNPTSVVGTKMSVGTVTLQSNAAAGGATVSLASSDPNTANPAVSSITVAAGTKTKAFTINTSAVAASTQVTISGATQDGATKSAVLTVTPPGLSLLTVSPASVAGTLNSVGKVTLSGAAPAGGIVVSVSSSNPAVANPAVSSVTVAAGATTASFTITTTSVTASTQVTISATLGAVTKNAVLTVRPPNVISVSAWPNPVPGSKMTTGTVTLEAVAPAGGVTVTLISGNTAYATVPSSITVPAGTKTNTFAINTSAVSSTQPVTITAITGAASKSFVLNVRPIGVLSVSLVPSSVIGGNPVAGTVTLEAAAAPGDITVTLTSSNTTWATVPASIIIPAGSTSGSFTVTTFHPAAVQSVNITATANGISKVKVLTIKP